jgi:HEAT repeat protein
VDINNFLSGQVEGMALRRQALDELRGALVDGDTPEACVAFVMARVESVYDGHPETVRTAGMSTAAEGAQAAIDVFRPIADDLRNALALALVDVWNLRDGEDE